MSYKGREIADMPFRILKMVRDTLKHEYSLAAEMATFGEGVPIIKTSVGNVMYFASSNTFRLHFNNGSGNKTFSTPDETVAYFANLNKGESSNESK